MANIIRETSKGTELLPVADVLLDRRTVFLTDPVDANTCSELIKQFLYLESEAPGEEIVFCINSPGGEVSSGLALYDLIRMLTSPVRTVCVGTAASMGSLLYLAGETREMLPHARIMIHDPSYSRADFSHMKPGEIEKELDDLKKCRDTLCAVIAERTGHTIEEICEKTKIDTYFDAGEAVEYGLATGILSSAASIVKPKS